MTQNALASLSFADLRNRLKVRADELGRKDDINLIEVLRYLATLPDEAHTSDSVDALICLARNFFYGTQPVQQLQAASLASRLADRLGQKVLLYEAYATEGIALADLGRFAEAAMTQAESWRLARTLEDIEREIRAIARVAGLWGAMAQFDVAITYFARTRDQAAEHGFADLEQMSRNNIADCSFQLKDPLPGLRALAPYQSDAPKTRLDAIRHANAHDTLGHLYLLTGDTGQAKIHAQESRRFAKLAGVKRTTHFSEALLGLIDVKSGAVEHGLAAVERALTFAKRVDRYDVPHFLGICVDAYEAAGQSERALAYLQELVAWKKKSIDREIATLPAEVFAESSLPLRRKTSAFDSNLIVRAQHLQIRVWQRTQHFIETAINAEIASGHDLYRTFRVAKLARYLAAALGWDEERAGMLALGAQLCNIGMIAIPARILLKPVGLSDGERCVLRDHTGYGAELLRKSKLQMLDVAAIVAEQHHECFDGSGYPRGLKREAIVEEARIVTICDAFDAMTHRRPWRRTPLSIQAALHELKQGMGTQFDPSFVDAFVDLIRREFWEHDDFDAFLAAGAHEVDYVRVRARMEAMIADEGESRAQAA